MASFESRERAFENKYAFDQEQQFRTNARRNKLFGLWAANQLGLELDAASLYAQQTVLTDFEYHGEHSKVLNKVYHDLQLAHKDLAPATLQSKYEQLFDEARLQLDAEM